MDRIPHDPLLEFQPDALEAIRRAIGMDCKRMKESIDILEEWMKKQKHFLKKDFDREYLERTLLACKGSVEKAKTQIDKLCTFKTLLPKFFKHCDVKTDLKTVTEIAWLLPLPKMTKDYHRTFLVKINDKKFTAANYMEYYRLTINVCEYLKAHDYVNGFTIVDDYRSLNLAELLTKLNVVELQQFMTILIEGYGARMLSINILTESKIVDTLIKILKQVLSPKIASRIHVHGTIESLYEFVDRESLPEEYGGSERSVAKLSKDWIEVLSSTEHKEYIKMMSAAGTDESLRTKNKFNEEYLGMPGTFRTLSLD